MNILSLFLSITATIMILTACGAPSTSTSAKPTSNKPFQGTSLDNNSSNDTNTTPSTLPTDSNNTSNENNATAETNTTLTLTPNTKKIVVGEHTQFHALFHAKTSTDITNDANWSIADEHIASIQGDTFFAQSVGNTTITASYQGLTTTASLQVIDIPTHDSVLTLNQWVGDEVTPDNTWRPYEFNLTRTTTIHFDKEGVKGSYGQSNDIEFRIQLGKGYTIHYDKILANTLTTNTMTLDKGQWLISIDAIDLKPAGFRLRLRTDPETDLSAEKQDLLDAHNEARNAVGVTQALTWDDTLEADAQSYANTLAQSGAWKHDPKNSTGYANGPYGENLYAEFNSTGKIPSFKKAALSWIDEKAFYHYGTIGDPSTCETGKMCGHYTQIIWKNTTQVGCARSLYTTGNYKDWYLIVCKYKTPGNYEGESPY